MTQWGLDTLFNPAKRHMDEEKRRLQSTREEVGDASGGKRIDFESGKVVIHRSTDENHHASSTESDKPVAESDQAASKSTGKAAAKSKPSAAAIRAAQRRGRQVR